MAMTVCGLCGESMSAPGMSIIMALKLHYSKKHRRRW